MWPLKMPQIQTILLCEEQVQKDLEKVVTHRINPLQDDLLQAYYRQVNKVVAVKITSIFARLAQRVVSLLWIMSC